MPRRTRMRTAVAALLALGIAALDTVCGATGDARRASPNGPVATTRRQERIVAAETISHGVFLPYVAQAIAAPPPSDQAGGRILALAPAGERLYAVRGARFVVIDVRDPSRPEVVGRTPDHGCSATDMDARGDVAYVTCDRDLLVFDASRPTVPRLVGRLDLGHAGSGVRARDDLVVVAAGTGGVLVVDVHVPERPRLIGSTTGLPNALDVALRGPYALVAAGTDVLAVVDIADPAHPTVVHGTFGQNTGPPFNATAAGIDVSGELAVVAQGEDYRYMTVGGVHVYDVRDPARPVRLATWQPGHYARDVRMSGTWALLTFDDDGMTLLDLSEPAVPRVIASDGTTPVADARFAGTRAYVASSGTIEVLDVSRVAGATVLGRQAYEDDRRPGVTGAAAHDGFVFAVPGREGLLVADARDPAAIRWIARVYIPDGASAAAWMDDRLFIGTHAGVVEADVRFPDAPRPVATVPTSGEVAEVVTSSGFVYAASWKGDLWVLDARTPGAPRGIGHVALGGGYGLDLVVAGGYVYVSRPDGLHVVDVHAPGDPREVGFLAVPPGFGMSGVSLHGRHVRVGLYMSAMYSTRGWGKTIDVSDPTAPRWAHDVPVDDEVAPTTWGVVREGDRAYAFEEKAIVVYDTSTARAPLRLGRLPAEVPVVAADVAIGDGRVVVLDSDASSTRDPWAPSGRVLVYAGELEAAAAVADITLPLAPLPDGWHHPYAVALAAGRAYVPSRRAMPIYDVSGAGPARLIGSYIPSDGGTIDDVFVEDRVAFVRSECTVRVVDVSDAARPAEVSSWTPPSGRWCTKLAMTGRRAFLVGQVESSGSADTGSLWVIDLTEPARPIHLGEANVALNVTDVAAAGSLLALGTRAGIDLVDVADPAHPRAAGTMPLGYVEQLLADGRLLCVAQTAAMRFVDLSDAARPRVVASAPVHAAGMFARDGVLHVAGGERGLQRLRLPALTR